MAARFTNETAQSIRLTLWIGGALRRVELTGTVWSAFTNVGDSQHHLPPARLGRVKHGRKEYTVTWDSVGAVWSHVETPPQYDDNERGD